MQKLQPSNQTNLYQTPYKLAANYVSRQVLNSYVMERIMIFLDQEQALKLQQLNKFMYQKSEKLMPIVLGYRIEDCILLYSDYNNKSGAVSVVIGRPEKSEEKPAVVSD